MNNEDNESSNNKGAAHKGHNNNCQAPPPTNNIELVESKGNKISTNRRKRKQLQTQRPATGNSSTFRAEQEPQDDDDNPNCEVERPLIGSQASSQVTSNSSLTSGSKTRTKIKIKAKTKVDGMVQVELNDNRRQSLEVTDGGGGVLVGPKLKWPHQQQMEETSEQQVAGASTSGASSSTGSSSSVLLDSSRRSSSIYAVDMRPLVLMQEDERADLEELEENNNACDSQRPQMGLSFSNLTPSLSIKNDNKQQLLRSSSTSNCFSQQQVISYTPLGGAMRTHEGSSDECLWRKTKEVADGTTPTLKRTISRSMLEFDPSIEENDKFLLTWRNLTFAYAPSWTSKVARFRGQKRREILKPNGRQELVLNNLSGSICSNQLVAVMGPSGCGKTTLLQFLASNNAGLPQVSCGQVRLRGHLRELKVAYIGQDDDLLPGLTARETLVYASRLQNNARNFNHQEHIKPILNELGLTQCADRSVAKLSGGQAKRVTIAQELLYPTNLLILDEVTSGLDASTSYAIVKLLKYLISDSSYPMSIVMSIHQPSARLFSVFDRVYVMSAGRCLYEGGSNLNQINKHLGQFQLECPKFHNIADYLIELACCSSGGDLSDCESESESENLHQEEEEVKLRNGSQQNDHDDHDQNQKAQLHKMSSIRRQMVEFQRKESEQEMRESQDSNQDNRGDLNSTKQNDCDFYEAVERARCQRLKPFWPHLRLHFSRSLLRIRRSYILTWLQLITYIILGLQLATFYGADVGQRNGCPHLPGNLMSYILTPTLATSSQTQDGQETQDDDDDDPSLELRRIQENMNFLLVTVMTATFAALEITVITFPLEAKTVKREWRNGWYNTSSYFAGRTLADLPFQLAFVLIFCLLIYSLTGQLGLATWRFGSFVLIIIMTASIAQSFGLIFGALFMNNLPAAVFTAPLAIFPTLLFSGFFSRVSQVPAFYRPLTYLSHFRYAFDALLVTLYGFQRCPCDQEALDHYHASLSNQTNSMRDMFHLLFGASDCITASSGGESGSGLEQEGQEVVTTTQMPQNQGNDELISREDLAAIQASNATLGNQLMSLLRNQSSTTTTTIGAAASSTTMAPTGSLSRANQHHLSPAASASASASLKQLEDLLVESAFQQMAAASNSAVSSNNNSDFMSSSANDTFAAIEMSPMDRLASQFSTKLTGMLSKQANFGHSMPRQCERFNSYLLAEFNLVDNDLWFGLAMLLVAVLLTRLLCNFILNFTIASRAK